MLRKFFIFVFFIFCASVYSQTISSISIKGLKKTREDFIMSSLEKYIGTDCDSVNLNTIETELRSLDLFSDVGVNINKSAEDAVLEVSVMEKITFIPLPFASYSNDGFMGGFMLMNMNTFGTKCVTVVGGIFSSSMQMAIFNFNKPSLDIKHPGFSFSMIFNNKESDYRTVEDDDYLDFDSMTFKTNGALSLRLNKNFGTSLGFEYSKLYSYSSDIDHIDEWLIGPGISWNTSRWNGYYMIDNGASINCSLGTNSNLDFIRNYQGRFIIEADPISRIRFILNGSGEMDYNRHIAFMTSSSNVGCNILNSHFNTHKIALLRGTIETAVLKHQMLTLSLYGNYEHVFTQDVDDSFVYNQGIGSGVKVYLQKVAFPACMFGVSYNISQNYWNYAISVGFGY